MKLSILTLFCSTFLNCLIAEENLVKKDAVLKSRHTYGQTPLLEQNMDIDPMLQFDQWFKEAKENPFIVEAEIAVLSTTHDCQSHLRSMKVLNIKNGGFVLITNLNSSKATAIKNNPKVSLLFPWYAMDRQVIVFGTAKQLSEREADDYFASIPWASQIGAWVSDQSKKISSREELELRWKEFASIHPQGTIIKRPQNFGCFLIVPQTIEFFQARHANPQELFRTYGYADRIIYTKKDSKWTMDRLQS
jgi:pyridoxamine 5'-phosphate oxidase